MERGHRARERWQGSGADEIDIVPVTQPHRTTLSFEDMSQSATNASLTVEDLVAPCRKEMTAYKAPKIVQFIDALPKSNVGKILRRELCD